MPRRAHHLAADKQIATRVRDTEPVKVLPDILGFLQKETELTRHTKLRTRTGLTDDGAALVDRSLTGDPPMLAISPLETENQKGEQRGFANLLRGTFGMFRNPTAHEARIHWPIGKEDAEDLLSLVSLIHRRLDGAHMPPRV